MGYHETSLEWPEFLKFQGAIMDTQGNMRFAELEDELSEAEAGNLMSPLTGHGVIHVSGKDAAGLIQGQVTNDVGKVSATRSQLSAMCNPKGRVISSFRIVHHEGGYLLVLPRAMVDATVRRLRMFVLRSDARVEDESDHWALLGLQGVAAGDRLGGVLGTAPPDEPDHAVEAQGISVTRLTGATAPRYLLVGSPTAMQPVWTQLRETIIPVGSQAWSLTQVLAGEPAIYPETSDSFIPQMINLQALGGISFKKGCYAGQEVVARTQYLGKVKRRLYRAHVNAVQPPDPGAPLFAPGSTSGQGTGRVVSVAPHPQGGYELLAVIQIESADRETLYLGDAQGPKLELEQLPYPLED